MRRPLLVSLVVLLAACNELKSTPPFAPTPPAPILASDVPPPPRADGRLPSTVVPTHYAVRLAVDPAKPRFAGEVLIDVDVHEATRFVVLHAHGLKTSATSAVAAGKTIRADPTLRVAHGGLEPDELLLAFTEALPVGKATISITYDAPFGADLSGLYRVKEGDRWYAFTQFESTRARRAFPCFDEPGYKATFDLAVSTPSAMIAVANSPEKSHIADGLGRRFVFDTTPPLPTYLVAFAVGDFDVREGSKDPIPTRLITAKGKAPLGGAALETTTALTRVLGDYFAIPYPFAKLDIVAVPDFAAGAMENPGLITFREELLLQDPKHVSAHGDKLSALVIAHELAHIWFGDYVTMQWWNDIWLNEGFADFMENKTVEKWKPSWGSHMELVANTIGVMGVDALANARAVRQPVSTTSEIEEAFDGITYEKGSAVLRMIEHWVGEEAFQKGVREYVAAHKFGSATSTDLLSALDHASGRDVTGMAATFLDRPGVPNVAMTPKCEGNKVTFDLTQAAWRPLGVQAKPTDGTPWHIPVCAKDASGKDVCAELSGAAAKLEVGVASCPAAVYPNADGAGYYRFSLPEADMRALAHGAAKLDAPSRVGLIANMWAEVKAGALGPGVLLDALTAFDKDGDQHVVEAVISVIEGIDRALIDESTRPAFRAYVAARLGGHARRLGWQARGGESKDDALSRPQVLQALGEIARDEATLKTAEGLAVKWLKEPASVEADIAPVALRLAAIHAPAGRLDGLRAAAKNAKTPTDRIAALSALAWFEDPETQAKAFDVALTDEVKMQDFRYVFFRNGALDRPRVAAPVFAWVSKRWDAVQAKLPGNLARRLAGTVSTTCSKEERETEVAFFKPYLAKMEGAPRELAEDEEVATSCAELRSSAGAQVKAYFAPVSAAAAAKDTRTAR